MEDADSSAAKSKRNSWGKGSSPAGVLLKAMTTPTACLSSGYAANSPAGQQHNWNKVSRTGKLCRITGTMRRPPRPTTHPLSPSLDKFMASCIRRMCWTDRTCQRQTPSAGRAHLQLTSKPLTYKLLQGYQPFKRQPWQPSNTPAIRPLLFFQEMLEDDRVMADDGPGMNDKGRAGDGVIT